LEFELSDRTLGLLIGLANRLEQVALPVAAEAGKMSDWADACEQFRSEISACQARMHDYCMGLRRGGILAASPESLWRSNEVSSAAIGEALPEAQTVVSEVVGRISGFIQKSKQLCESVRDESEDAKMMRETTAVYLAYFSEFREQAEMLFAPVGVSVTHAERMRTGGAIRRAVVDVAQPLRDLIWDRLPAACMSATLAIDGDFDWFRRVSGIHPSFQDVLPPALNFRKNAAMYLPPAGAVPDPARARQDGDMQFYYKAIANQVESVIAQMGGRTLVLFHSREEMERVKEILDVRGGMNIHMQRRSGAGHSGKKFRDEIESSLFGLRSFWTGFDAPGETLSCVCIVRIPFEVPIDPESVARNAYLRECGMDPFVAHTLPQAKLLMRQGVGRLLRTETDRGVIAIMDPRICTKRYGFEILENLPRDIRTFSNFVDAMAHVGLELPQAL
jgi:ATP-dependent DNA helicase DinG